MASGSLKRDSSGRGRADRLSARVVLQLCAMLFTAAMLLCTGCTQVDVGGQTRPLLRHKPFRGEVDLVAERLTDKQGTPGNKRKHETTIFEEEVHVETDGDVYHPDLLSYEASVGTGLTQREFRADGQTDSGSGSLDEYRLSGMFLQKKRYPMSFYLDKSEYLTPRQFASSLKTDTKGNGATVSLRSETLPMQFQYSENETRQEGQSLLDQDLFTRNDKRFRYSVEHDFSRLSNVSLDLERNDVTQDRGGSNLDRVEDRYTLSHDVVFGPNEQHRLDSIVDRLEQSGDYELKRTLWQEQLRLQHSKTLETNYTLSYHSSERPTLTNNETLGRAGFRHKLFQSLITTGNIYMSKADLGNNVDQKRQGTGLGFDYRKKNKLGTFSANYGIDVLDLEQNGGNTLVSVTDERHAFEVTGSLRIRLDRANVDESTIVVMSSDRLKVYSDYTLSHSGGLTELLITPGGDITTDGDQTLSIDYDFYTEPQRDERATVQTVRVQQRLLNGLSVYYELRDRSEQVSSTQAEIVQDEFTINLFGMDYTKKDLRLLAEYTKEDSTRVPLTSKRIEGSYIWRLGPDTRLSTYLANDWLNYTPEVPYDVVMFRAGGLLSNKLTDHLSITSDLAYRDEDDSRQGVTKGYQSNTELTYKFRQLSISTGIEFNFLKRLEHETDSQFFYFRLKRKF